MHSASFPCPHCSAPLRIRDRMFVGRDIPCPDCGRPLHIVADGPKGFAARPAASAGAAAAISAPASAAGGGNAAMVPPPLPSVARLPRAASWTAWLVSPTGIAWAVAGGLTVTFVVVLFGGEDDVQAETAPTAPRAAGVDPDDADPAAPPEAVAAENEHEPLRWLGEELAAYRARHGHFPGGVTTEAGALPVDDRFSWLAMLVAESEKYGGEPPRWDQPWNTPANDRFVRRGLPELLHPAIPRKAGENRYPATHYVGVAGVGDDAALLPIDHPRAGIFGFDRRTRLEDIRDGAANTIAVAAVSDRLGSWSAGGVSTVRGFTREPYIGGPDGFGVGAGEELPVLMADGSVRNLAPDTDPALIRRMAAMSDGLPLDLSVPGEPGDPAEPLDVAVPADPPLPPEPVMQVPPAPAEPEPAPKLPEEPIEVVVPPSMERIDVAARLAQRIRRFEQTRPVTALELLAQIEEMCGFPIRYDEQEFASRAAAWESTITLELEQTTVGEILDALLERIDAHYTVEHDGIRLHPGPLPKSLPQ